jgi:type 1 glutamine amidotransferase
VLQEELTKDPRMKVELLKDPYKLDVTDLAGYDALLLHFMNWEKPDPNDRAKENLRNFVERGGGLVIIHFACGAFQGWPEYVVLAGRIYDRTNTHDPRGPFTVNLANTRHPLTRGMPSSFDTDDELYICLTGDKPVELLASARSKITKRDHPMGLVHNYGKGRVFLTPLGHDVKALRAAGTADLIRRATAWTAGREPTEPSSQPAVREKVLFDFDRGFDFAKVTTEDAAVAEAKSPSGSRLRVTTGHRQSWPGVTLPAPTGHWDLSPFASVALTIRNVGSNELRISCRVDNPGADGRKNCVTDSLALGPGRTGSLKVALKRDSDDKLGGKLFGMRGYPVTAGGPGTVEPKNITQLLLFVNRPGSDHVFEVDDIRATGAYTPPTARVTDAEPFFPFIDAFGQYKHRDWAGKVHSFAELTERREAEAKELAAEPARSTGTNSAAGRLVRNSRPAASSGSRSIAASGGSWIRRAACSSRTGSIACGCSTPRPSPSGRNGSRTSRAGRRSSGSFSRPATRKGHYAGRSPQCFSFSAANLFRKYGADWKEFIPKSSTAACAVGASTPSATGPMKRRACCAARLQTPSSSRGAKMIEGSEGYWGKFPDVFDLSFEAGVRRSMTAKKDKSAGDPWCLGYFSDNEMSWGDDVSLALAALRSPPEQAAKKVFLADLKKKYGDIARLNAAWGTQHESWDALLESREAPDRTKARADLTAFYSRAAEQYFRTVRDAIKAVAPNQLYLGCRFAWVNERAAIAAGKYCDVVSYNLINATSLTSNIRAATSHLSSVSFTSVRWTGACSTPASCRSPIRKHARGLTRIMSSAPRVIRNSSARIGSSGRTNRPPAASMTKRITRSVS